LVARSAEKLEAVAAELSAKHGIQTLALSSDLAAPAAPQQVYDQVSARNIAVEVLVNNAGIGNYGPFHENDVETHFTKTTWRRT